MRAYEKCGSCVIHEEMKAFLGKYANGDMSGIGSREFLERFANKCPAVGAYYASIGEKKIIETVSREEQIPFRKPSLATA